MNWILIGIAGGITGFLFRILQIKLSKPKFKVRPIDTRTVADDISNKHFQESPEDWDVRVKLKRERIRNK